MIDLTYNGVGSVSKLRAENIFQVFEWMIQCFTPKHGFFEDILFPESEADFFATVPPTNDEIMHIIWIEKRFLALKDWCQMGKWPISIQEQPDELVTRRKGRTQQNRLTEIHSSIIDEKYYVDDYGRTIFYYLKHNIMDPGYINYRIMMKLADQLHKTGPKPIEIRKTPNPELYIIGGVFMGFGHLFCAGNRVEKIMFRENHTQNKAAFALAIYFKMRGMSQRQAFKTCSHLMSDKTKSDLRIAFRQLLFYKKRLHKLRTDYEEKIAPIVFEAA